MAKFIVIDGLDGCGKATQVEKLKQRISAQGYNIHILSFPFYDSNSSALVQMYLSGELGEDTNAINPYVASSFFAVDRFASFYRQYFKYFEEDDNTIILADRYISANIIHQSSKISDVESRHNFIRWCYEFECNLCRLPKEDITILLTIPPTISQKLLAKRYHGNIVKDIHENNLDYLLSCYDMLDDTVKFINEHNIANWKWLDCTQEDNIKPIDLITDEIYTIIDGYLIKK